MMRHQQQFDSGSLGLSTATFSVGSTIFSDVLRYSKCFATVPKTSATPSPVRAEVQIHSAVEKIIDKRGFANFGFANQDDSPFRRHLVF
jgi:hypothetical protein